MSTSTEQPFRLVAIGDVGAADRYHVGDEAMLGMNLRRLRELDPSLQVTVVTGAPAETAATYAVDTVGRIGFPHAADQEPARAKLLETVLQAAGRLHDRAEPPPASPGRDVIRAVAGADGVLLSGGGNLSSSWPDHLYERVALLRLASLFRIPAVASGQTIGPELTFAHERMLADALNACRWIGCREEDSRELLQAMGVPPERTVAQLDDALWVPGEGPPAPVPELPGGDWIAVTVHPFADPTGDELLYARLAGDLARIACACAARLVFLPHVAFPEGGGVADRTVADILQRHIGDRAECAVWDVLPYPAAGRITAAAGMVISTRYHPLVFAMGGGVPALGLYVDEYTRWKLRGALAPAGLEGWTMPLMTGLGGLLPDAAAELWTRRAEISQAVAGMHPAWAAAVRAHARRVAVALGILRAPAASPPLPGLPRPSSPCPPRQGWAAVAAYADAQCEHLYRRARLGVRYAQSLEAHLRQRESAPQRPRPRWYHARRHPGR